MDISRFFQTSSESISDFFHLPGVGYYTPLYQREYSWDTQNIEQLMDDICSGVSELQTNPDQIHFMGTIILVIEDDIPNNITPQDSKAIPSRIDNIIDGQQRISTISLLACCLYQEIYEIKVKMDQIDQNHEFAPLQDAFASYFNKLQELFSFNLGRGQPERKPILIRGSIDAWTLEGEESKYYKSDISSYLANFIKTIQTNTNYEFPRPPKKSLVEQNIEFMKDWLSKVKKSHNNNEINYPSAWNIISSKINQSELWIYERKELAEQIQSYEGIESFSEIQNYLCSLVQLFAFSYYLLQRCCFTIIKPVSKVRAFDMFQSLNATGTPLTAIETFKPLVVNIAASNGLDFKSSNFYQSFTRVEDLMKKLKSASSKNQRTNEYLSLFSLTYEGRSLLRQFSKQRQWLIDQFEKGCSSVESQDSSLSSLADKEEFINKMGKIAAYSQDIIYSSSNLNKSLPNLTLLDERQRKIASFCLVYLKEANHRMAHTVLSLFYALSNPDKLVEDNDDNQQTSINYQEDFAVACKAITAFFTLWRSALPNTGLDDVYRDLLQEKMSWQQQKRNNAVTSNVLKDHLKNALQKKGILNQDSWKSRAINNLRYDNVKAVCKFVIFISSNDTICDSQEPGLMKLGVQGSTKDYLEPNQWNSDNLKSVEHIAPQKPDQDQRVESQWDNTLYDNDDYHQIGNLTLLPTSINTSVSNKGWIEKWIYYQYLSETDPTKLEDLRQKAEENNVKLKNVTIDLLKKASHAHHVKPIVELGVAGNWNKALVEKRTERICDILWQRMYEWLS